MAAASPSISGRGSDSGHSPPPQATARDWHWGPTSRSEAEARLTTVAETLSAADQALFLLRDSSQGDGFTALSVWSAARGRVEHHLISEEGGPGEFYFNSKPIPRPLLSHEDVIEYLRQPNRDHPGSPWDTPLASFVTKRTGALVSLAAKPNMQEDNSLEPSSVVPSFFWPSSEEKLMVHEARYGWAKDLWNVGVEKLGKGSNHGDGAKDVTDVVRTMIGQGDDVADNELHINPHCQGLYMNETFWPETASWPLKKRALAVCYSYGNDHDIKEVETERVHLELVALRITPQEVKATPHANGMLSNTIRNGSALLRERMDVADLRGRGIANQVREIWKWQSCLPHDVHNSANRKFASQKEVGDIMLDDFINVTHSVSMGGFLVKLPESWYGISRRRWFVLHCEEQVLAYYSDPLAPPTKTQRKGEILLSSVATCERSGTQIRIIMIAGQSPIKLLAEDEKTATEWAQAIQQALIICCLTPPLRLDEAMARFWAMLFSEMIPEVGTCNKLISCLSNAENAHQTRLGDAMSVCGVMEWHGYSLSLSAFVAILTRSTMHGASCAEVHVSMAVFWAAKKMGLLRQPPTTDPDREKKIALHREALKACSNLISVCSKMNPVLLDYAIEVFETILDAMKEEGGSYLTCTGAVISMIACFANAIPARVDDATAMISNMKRDGQTQNFSTDDWRLINDWLITCCANASPVRFDLALEKFLDIVATGLQPNGYALGSLVAYCTTVRPVRLNDAMLMFKAMASAGALPAVETCNRIITSCARSDQVRLDDVLVVLKSMKAAGEAPDVGAFGELILYCLNSRPARLGDAVTLFKTMQSSGAAPDVDVCNLLIASCANASPDRIADTIVVLDATIAAGLTPAVDSINAVIDCCTSSKPERLCDAMVAFNLAKGVVMPDIARCTFLISHCTKASPAQLDDALTVLRAMMLKGMAPGLEVFADIIDGCGSASPARAGDAMEVFNTMTEEAGLTPGSTIFTAVIDSCVSAGPAWLDNAFAVLRRMRSAGLTPATTVFLNVMNACCEAEPARVGNAMEVFEAMKTDNAMEGKPDVESSTHLILCCISTTSPRLDDAMNVLHTLKSAKAMPAYEACASLIACCAEINPARVKDVITVVEGMSMCDYAMRKPDVENLSKLITRCATGPAMQLDDAIAVLEVMKPAFVVPDKETMNRLLSGCIGANPAGVDDALSVFKTMSNERMAPDLGSFNSLLTCLTDRLDDAMSVLGAMQPTGMQPDVTTFVELMTCCVNAEPVRLDDAMLIFYWMDSLGVAPYTKTCNDLITTCATARPARLHTAMTILKVMRQLKLQPSPRALKDMDKMLKILGMTLDTPMFNSLLVHCVKSSPARVDDGLAVIETMKAAGLAPQVATCNRLINRCATASPARVDDALATLKAMESMGITPGIKAFAALIKCCAAATPPRVDDAMAIFKTMQSASLEPEIATYNRLIRCCATASPVRIDGAIQISEEIKQAGLELDVESFRALIACYAKLASPNVADVLILVETMKSQKLTPNEAIESDVVTCCAKAQPTLVADEMVVLSAMETAGVNPNAATFNSLLVHCAKSSPARVDDALAVIETMKAAGLAPQVATYNILISCCANANPVRIDDAIGVLETMKRERMEPGPEKCSTLIMSCVHSRPAQIDGAMRVFSMMQLVGKQPNSAACDKLIVACAGARPLRIDDAMAVFMSMLSSDLKPDVVACTSLINAYARIVPVQLDAVQNIIDMMQEEGLIFDLKIFNSFLDACANADPVAFERAKRVLLKIREHGFEPNRDTALKLLLCYTRHQSLSVVESVVENTSFFEALLCSPGLSVDEEIKSSLIDAFGDSGSEHILALCRVDNISDHAQHNTKFQEESATKVRHARRKRANLPILRSKRIFIDRLISEKLVIVVAETGSGKTTQLPQYCAEHFFDTDMPKIICTQPRVIAASSIAKRVASEFDGARIGKSVGYSAGVKHVKGSRIIFMTDAALVRLVQRDPLLTSVSVLIIDEAHERSLNTDLVLGIAKQIMQDHRRQETFHVVVASATIDPKPFVKFFTGEPTGAAREKHVLDVEGRTFDVTLEYKPIWCHEGRLQIATRDLIGAVTEAMEENQDGHVLVFLPGSADIIKAVKAYGKHRPKKNVDVFPLYGGLSEDDQQKVFNYHDCNNTRRMLVFCTNIAETSVTVPNVQLVVDTGIAKEAEYEPTRRMTILKEVRISRSSADQRKGRAGRTAAGHCVRLYAEAELKRPSIVPEIKRSSLDHVVLRLVAAKRDPERFPYMDAPNSEHLRSSIELLKTKLCCIRSHHDGPRFQLTSIGSLFNELPFDPRLSAFVLEGILTHNIGPLCVRVAALLAAPGSVFFFGRKEDDARAQESRQENLARRAATFDSDLLNEHNVYCDWVKAGLGDCRCKGGAPKRAQKSGCQFCRKQFSADNSLNNKVLENVHAQVGNVERILQSRRFQAIFTKISKEALTAGATNTHTPRVDDEVQCGNDSTRNKLTLALLHAFREHVGALIVPSNVDSGIRLLQPAGSDHVLVDVKAKVDKHSAVHQRAGNSSASPFFIVMETQQMPTGLVCAGRLHPIEVSLCERSSFELPEPSIKVYERGDIGAPIANVLQAHFMEQHRDESQWQYWGAIVYNEHESVVAVYARASDKTRASSFAENRLSITLENHQQKTEQIRIAGAEVQVIAGLIVGSVDVAPKNDQSTLTTVRDSAVKFIFFARRAPAHVKGQREAQEWVRTRLCPEVSSVNFGKISVVVDHKDIKCPNSTCSAIIYRRSTQCSECGAEKPRQVRIEVSGRDAKEKLKSSIETHHARFAVKTHLTAAVKTVVPAWKRTFTCNVRLEPEDHRDWVRKETWSELAGISDSDGVQTKLMPSSVPPGMLTGWVQSWFEDKGYGFIKSGDIHDKTNVFCHFSALNGARALVRGARVFYQKEKGTEGRKKGKWNATNVSLQNAITVRVVMPDQNSAEAAAAKMQSMQNQVTCSASIQVQHASLFDGIMDAVFASVLERTNCEVCRDREHVSCPLSITDGKFALLQSMANQLQDEFGIQLAIPRKGEVGAVTIIGQPDSIKACAASIGRICKLNGPAEVGAPIKNAGSIMLKIEGPLPSTLLSARSLLAQVFDPTTINVLNVGKVGIMYKELQDRGMFQTWGQELGLHLEISCNEYGRVKTLIVHGPGGNRGALLKRLGDYMNGFEKRYRFVPLPAWLSCLFRGPDRIGEIRRKELALRYPSCTISYSRSPLGIDLAWSPETTDYVRAQFLREAERALDELGLASGPALSGTPDTCMYCKKEGTGLRLSSCGHGFCIDCVKDIAMANASSGTGVVECIQCKASGQAVTVLPRDMVAAMGKDEFATFAKDLTEETIKMNRGQVRGLALCPNEACRMIIKDGGGYHRCVQCKAEICCQCGVVEDCLHKQISCAEFQAAKRHLRHQGALFKAIENEAFNFVRKCWPLDMPPVRCTHINPAMHAQSPAPSLKMFRAGCLSVGCSAEHVTRFGHCAWHGTFERSVQPICYEGLDPNRRSGQVYGPGEYFGQSANISNGYCRGSTLMIVAFILKGPHYSKHSDFCFVINNPLDKSMAFAMPVAVVQFGDAEPEFDLRSAPRLSSAPVSSAEAAFGGAEEAVDQTPLLMECLWRWHWRQDDGSFEPYTDEINSIIERKYDERRTTGLQAFITPEVRRYVNDKLQKYKIDFDQQLQIHTITGYQRAIRRQKQEVLLTGSEKHVIGGGRLPTPGNAAEGLDADVWVAVSQCFANRPSGRPTFAQLGAALGQLGRAEPRAASAQQQEAQQLLDDAPVIQEALQEGGEELRRQQERLARGGKMARLAKLADGIAKVASVSLAISHPTKASAPHLIVSGFKIVIAVALATDITLNKPTPGLENAKLFLSDPEAFAAANAGSGAQQLLDDAPVIQEALQEGGEELRRQQERLARGGKMARLAKLADGIAKVASVSLAISHPTKASAPHLIVSGFKIVIAVALATDITLNKPTPGLENAKLFLSDPEAFAAANAGSGGGGGGGDAPAEEKKEEAPAPAEEEEESDEDGDFSLFD